MTEKFDRRPRCPECPHDGPFDNRGWFQRQFRRSPFEEGSEADITQTWYVFGCTECGSEFALKTDETEEPL